MNKIKANFTGQTIFVGMDVHKSSWTLGIHLNDHFIRNVHQKPNPQLLSNYLHTNYPGAKYKPAYEAGKFGFWIQRQLTKLGIECLVVNPADIPKLRKIPFKKPTRGIRATSAIAYKKVILKASISQTSKRKRTGSYFATANGYGKILPAVKTASKVC